MHVVFCFGVEHEGRKGRNFGVMVSVAGGELKMGIVINNLGLGYVPKVRKVAVRK